MLIINLNYKNKKLIINKSIKIKIKNINNKKKNKIYKSNLKMKIKR